MKTLISLTCLVALAGAAFAAEKPAEKPKTLKDEFKVKTDLEFRSVQECAGMTGSVVPGARWVHVPFAAYDFIDNPARGRDDSSMCQRSVVDVKPTLRVDKQVRDRAAPRRKRRSTFRSSSSPFRFPTLSAITTSRSRGC